MNSCKAPVLPPYVSFGNFDTELHRQIDGQRVIIITDANVHLHNKAFVDGFEHIVIGQGEISKTMRTVEEILLHLAEMGADRQTLLVGMGGGIVTDITGFVASTYMRGISFGFIPTTLLGQVDASIGGKNGVNLNGYKNMVGTFNTPKFVIIDPSLLATLPQREFLSGMAEVIKVSIIGDCSLFNIVENHSPKEIAASPELLDEIIRSSIAVKWSIVDDDKFETGNRRKLNLGHTFGHAIEKCSQRYNHGEAVAIGIKDICVIAEKVGKLSSEDADRIRKVLTNVGLPMDCPIEMRKLMSAIRLDKKRGGDDIYLILPSTIGNCDIVRMKLSDLEELSK